MANYLKKTSLEKLNEARKKIFALREEIYKDLKIDVLDNDTLSSLSVYEIISQYDPDYNINFSRNGEDAISNGVLIEQKCSRIERDNGKSVFMFHAMGNLDYPRYIFALRRKENLELIRIYDISGEASTAIVKTHLMEERNKWLERGRLDSSKMKHDVITVPEALLVKNLTVVKREVINGCEVVWA